ncbi:hypothetical protein MBLNU459_g6701t1 [Dothideomycetes sp. NU459]
MSTNPFRRTLKGRQEPHPSENNMMPTRQEFLPPPGPPPSHRFNASETFEPPPGPPPSVAGPATSSVNAPPPEYEPWLAVPDTSSLPPPPSVNYKESPTANASEDSAQRARGWCRQNQLYAPVNIHAEDRKRLDKQGISFAKPPVPFMGVINQNAGSTLVRTQKHCPDAILMTEMPLYFATHDNPRVTGKPRTVYFEISVKRMGNSSSAVSEEADAGIAIGFVAPPYPPFRLPGWERSSLGVHGDDGRRYVDNNEGGQDFTTFFKEGEVVGLGMTFNTTRFQDRKNEVEIFFTRDGERVGGWNLHEERDQDDEGSVNGLEGDRDLLGAVGMFGSVEFEARFRRDEWLYRPR